VGCAQVEREAGGDEGRDSSSRFWVSCPRSKVQGRGQERLATDETQMKHGCECRENKLLQAGSTDGMQGEEKHCGYGAKEWYYCSQRWSLRSRVRSVGVVYTMVFGIRSICGQIYIVASLQGVGAVGVATIFEKMRCILGFL